MTSERREMIETAKKLCPSAVEDIEGGYFYQACRHLLTELQRVKRSGPRPTHVAIRNRNSL